MLSMIIVRMTRLRPAISVGTLASGTRPSTKSGYVSPQHPAVHRAHRRAENQPQVIHFQAVDEHGVLRADHVVVVYFGNRAVERVARLARLPVTDAVGQDDEVARGIEQLAGGEQFAAKRPRQKARAGPTGA